MPTLVHDGRPVIELTLICEYLDEAFPTPRLIPAEAGQRARMRLWSKAVDEGLFEGITEISFSAMFRERMQNMPADLREPRFRNIGDPRRRDRFISTYELGVKSPYVLYAIAAYERAFKSLEETLAEGGPWILGDDPTLADINLMPLVARLDYLRPARRMDRLPAAGLRGGPASGSGRASSGDSTNSSPKPNSRKWQSTGLSIRADVAARLEEARRLHARRGWMRLRGRGKEHLSPRPEETPMTDYWLSKLFFDLQQDSELASEFRSNMNNVLDRYEIKPEIRKAVLEDDVATIAPLVNAYLLRFYFQIRGMPEPEFIARLNALNERKGSVHG